MRSLAGITSAAILVAAGVWAATALAPDGRQDHAASTAAPRETPVSAQAPPEAAAPADTGVLPPLVVFVLIDTLRADHVGAHGDSRGLTPNIDALAMEGVVFERATAASSWTRASVASIFTGLFAETHGVVDREHSLPAEAVTIAELIRGAGGTALGVQANGNVDRDYGFDAGFERYVEPSENSGYPGEQRFADAASVTAAALALLDEFTGARAPLFLYLHYIDPHDPYMPHPGLGRGPAPEGRFDGSRKSLRRMDNARPGSLGVADYARIKRLYEEEVAFVDRHVGRLFEELRRRGLWERALVLMTSDHGEGLWDHKERGHGRDLYEEQIHVPLILRWPGPDAPRGQRIDERVSHVDLPVTVLARFGIPRPKGWPGADLLELARGATAPRPWAYASLELDWNDYETLLEGDDKLIRPRGGDASRQGRMHTVSTGESWISLSWKYFGHGKAAAAFQALNPEVVIRSNKIPAGTELRVPNDLETRNAGPKLFDLRTDPAEKKNLAATASEQRRNLTALLSRITEPMLRARHGAVAVDDEDLRESTRDRLRALGYME